ncbi:MAG: DUF748 domain-containing protein [Holophagales bacterium]|nr:DUF748 domain-containing protein [Holophagales bacterium]
MTKLPAPLRLAQRSLKVALPLVLLVLAASFFVDEPLRRSIERRMNDRLPGYDVRLPKLRVHVFSFSIALEGLTVRQKAHPEPPVLHIERLTTSIHWRALLSARLVADVLLVRPRVDMDLVQLREEVKDGVPVNERGWQEALQEVTLLKIDLFRVEDGTVTYVDADAARPIRLTSLRIRANDIRNVKSKPDVYPSPIHAEATLFGSGRGTLDGHANFLAEPYPGFRALFRLDAVPLDALSLPVRSHTSFVLAGGILAAAGDLETSPAVRNLRLSKLSLSGVTLDYVQAKAGSAEPSAAATPPPATAAAKAKGPPPPEPEWAIRMDKILISSSELGFVNRATDPGYRAYFSRLDGSISDLGNHASGARAYYDLRGRFLGSGETKLTGSFREGSENPDFDANLRIESTDMTLMNDLLRSYGKFDVVAGRFSFYSELKARDGNIEGYVKPLFKGMDVYDRRQDRDKSVFRKGYEMLVGGVAGLLRNSERKQVATVATVSGRLDEPDTSGWQIAVRLVGNAFFQSILPGFDRELERLPAKGKKDEKRSAPGAPVPAAGTPSPVPG